MIIEFSFILQKRKEKKEKERKRERERVEILTLLKRKEEYDGVSSLAEQAA